MRISDWSSDVCSSDLFEDADIEDAVAGAMIAKMRNMGEACTAANRFYVHSSVGEAFSTRLAERMAALKMGNGLDEEVAVRSEEHTSELQSLMRISYAVFCLKKKKNIKPTQIITKYR